MDRRTKIIVITATLILWALVGVIIGGGIYLVKKFEEAVALPKGIETTAVLIGGESFLKSTLHEESFIGRITDIKIKGGDPAATGEIVFAGSGGVLFLDINDPSIVNSSVYFEDNANFIEVIDIEGDGIEEFTGRGCWCRPPIVIDSEGETIWRYERRDEKVVDMVSADMDGDGELEFIAGLKDGGIRLIDRNDKKIFKKKTPPVEHVEVADVDADGRVDIIFTTTKGELITIDSSGKELSRTKDSGTEEGNIKIKDFTLVRWPTANDREYILSAGDGVVRFHDLFGKVVFDIKAERAYGSARVRGVGFNGPQGEDYFAVLLAHERWKRSVLYIYDDNLNVVYEEVLGGLYFSLALRPAMNGEGTPETLLIGGQGSLFGYTPAKDGDL